MATGVRPRHSRRCASRPANGGGRCSCSPSWEAWVHTRRFGKVTQTFSGPGAFAAAKGWRADAEAAKRRGKIQRQTRKTVYEAAVELVAGMRDGSILAGRGAHKRPYKPSVIRSYERKLGLTPEQRARAPERLVERLGDLRLTDLDRAVIEEYCGRLRAAGYSAATCHNSLDPLRVVLREARRRGEIGHDPFEGLELADRRTDARPRRIAQPAEAAALLEALGDDWRPLWATAFYAGLRRGELRALRVHAVDFPAGVIRVRCSWDDVEGDQAPKTSKAVRDVPIITVLRGELRDHLMRTGRRGTELVFGEDEVPFCPTTARRQAREAWAKAKLEPLTMHECRHTFASLLIAASVDVLQVADYMGHADTKTTTRVYGHLFSDARERAVRQVDAFLDRPAEGAQLRSV
jgi:integrase